MAAPRQRTLNRARNGEYLAALFTGQACRDQGAAAARRLHHHDTEAESADEPVTPGKMPRQRRGAGGELGYQRAVLRHLPGQAAVDARINDVQAVGRHRQGAPAAGHGAPVAGSVDAQRKPAGDHQSAASQLGAEAVSGFHATGCGPATADHGHLSGAQNFHITLHEQHRWRVGDVPQTRWKGRRDKGNQVPSGVRQPVEIGLDGAPVGIGPAWPARGGAPPVGSEDITGGHASFGQRAELCLPERRQMVEGKPVCGLGVHPWTSWGAAIRAAAESTWPDTRPPARSRGEDSA